MHGAWAGWVGSLLLAAPTAGAGQVEKVVEDRWEAAHVEGARVGALHTVVHEIAGEGGKQYRGSADLTLSIRRRGALLQVRMEHGTVETAEGRVLSVFMRQHHGSGQQLALAGQLEDGKMHVIVDRGRIDRHIWWNEDVVGLYRQERLFRERKLQPGDRYAYLAYEPIVNAVVTRRVAAVAPEAVLTAVGRKQLLRVEIATDRIQVPGTSLQLPPTVVWLDDQYEIQRRQIEVDGLGTVVLTRTDRAAATASGTVEVKGTDIGLKTLVPLARPVPRIHHARQAWYRIVFDGEAEAAGSFVSDAHQEVTAARGAALDLVVHPLRQPTGQGTAQAGTEFLAPSYYIDNDNQRIRDIARQVAGRETDPWQLAQRMERRVHQMLRPDNAAPFAPASESARTLRGDCRHYAVLTAALCRAVGVPARTAIGLVYVERDQKPYLGFHMWTEVCVAGHWRGLDATLGRGGVGAGHLKVADHSWHDTRSLTPLVPVQRVLGKIGVTVVRVEHGG